jgi:hypothetical protein
MPLKLLHKINQYLKYITIAAFLLILAFVIPAMDLW